MVGITATSSKPLKKSGECIFCENRIQQLDVIYKTTNWLIRHCGFPIKDAENQNPQFHFLIISKDHRPNDCSAISGWDIAEILDIIRVVQGVFQIKGGGLVHRVGNAQWSGATILHCHLHFIIPRVIKVNNRLKAIPIYVPIG